jgi:hypothetical protein
LEPKTASTDGPRTSTPLTVATMSMGIAVMMMIGPLP